MLNMMVVLHVSEAKANISGTISNFLKLYPQYLFCPTQTATVSNKEHSNSIMDEADIPSVVKSRDSMVLN
jgi:hypothetical protein